MKTFGSITPVATKYFHSESIAHSMASILRRLPDLISPTINVVPSFKPSYGRNLEYHYELEVSCDKIWNIANRTKSKL